MAFHIYDTDSQPFKSPRSISVNAPAAPFLCCWILGILAHRFLPLPLLGFLIVGVCAFIPIFLKNQTALLLLISFTLSWGFSLIAVESSLPHWQHSPPREVTVELQIAETFFTRSRSSHAGVAKIIAANIPDQSILGKSVAFYLESDEGSARDEVHHGAVVKARGNLISLPAVVEKSGYEEYLLSRSIYFSLNSGLILSIEKPPSHLEELRRTLFRKIESRLLSESDSFKKTSHVLASMFLGKRSLLEKSQIEQFKASGTMHYFAISGLHVGTVIALVLMIMRCLNVSNFLRIALSLFVLWFYVWVTGSTVSAVRAAIMATCLILAFASRRQRCPFSAYIIAGWIVLLWEPYQLFQVGFLLSFSVVGAILLVGIPLAIPIKKRFGLEQVYHSKNKRDWWKRFAANGIDLTTISFCAGMASAPLIIAYFELFTPGGIFLSLLLMQLSSLAIAVSVISTALGFITPLISTVINPIAYLAVEGMLAIIDWALQIPGFFQSRSWPSPALGIFYLIVSLYLAYLIRRRQQANAIPPNWLNALPMVFLIFSIFFVSMGS